MQNSQTKLNLLELKRMIDSGVAVIPVDYQFDNAVLVLGDTGVGKTTILSLLANRKLYIKTIGLNTILYSDSKDGLKIGHDRFSQTRVPAKIIVENIPFFDCSGFKDNRGEEFQISNSFFTQRLFNIYPNIKILLIIDESSVSETRADKLPKLLRNLFKSFTSLSDIQEGVILLINKAKSQFGQKVYIEQLLKLAKLQTENGHLLNQQERNFIEFLVKNNRVCILKQPSKSDQGKVFNIKQQNLIKLIKAANYIKGKKVRNIISENAKLCIREFIDHLMLTAEPKIKKFSKQIEKQFAFEAQSSYVNTVDIARQTKRKIVQFFQKIEQEPNEQVIQTIRAIKGVDLLEFEQDVSTIMFFKNIYDKSDYYFKTIRANFSGSVAKLVINMDSQIKVLEDQHKKMKQLQQKVEELIKKMSGMSSQMNLERTQSKLLQQKIQKMNKQFSQKFPTFALTKQKQTQIENLEKQILSLKLQINSWERKTLDYKQENNLLKEKSQSQNASGIALSQKERENKDLQLKCSEKDKQIIQLKTLANQLKKDVSIYSSTAQEKKKIQAAKISLETEIEKQRQLCRTKSEQAKNLSDEVGRIKSKCDSQILLLKQQWNEKEKQLQKQKSDLANRSNTSIAQFQKETKKLKQLLALKEKQVEKLNVVKEQSQQDKKLLVSKYQKQIAVLTQNKKNKQQQIQKIKEANAQLEEEKKFLNQKYQRQISTLVENYDQSTKNIENISYELEETKKNQVLVHELLNQNEQLKEKCSQKEKELESMKTLYSKYKEEKILLYAHQKQLTSWKQKYNLKQKEVEKTKNQIQQIQYQKQSSIQYYQQQIAKLKSANQKGQKAQIAQLQDAKKLISHYEAQISKMKQKINLKDKDYQKLKSTGYQAQKDIATLRQRYSIKEKQHEKMKSLAAQLQDQKARYMAGYEAQKDKANAKDRQIQSLRSKVSQLQNEKYSLSVSKEREEPKISYGNFWNFAYNNSGGASTSRSNNSTTAISTSDKKYPGLSCPHFKNGGQCIHCIRKYTGGK